MYIDYPEVDSSALTTVAFEVAYGPIGGGFLAAAITIFAWTTIIGMYYSCAKSVNYAFGDTLANRRASKVYMVYYMIPCVFFYNIQADALWAMTDHALRRLCGHHAAVHLHPAEGDLPAVPGFLGPLHSRQGAGGKPRRR